MGCDKDTDADKRGEILRHGIHGSAVGIDGDCHHSILVDYFKNRKRRRFANGRMSVPRKKE